MSPDAAAQFLMPVNMGNERRESSDAALTLECVRCAYSHLIVWIQSVPSSTNAKLVTPVVESSKVGQRGTRQRSAIRAVIDASPRPLLPQEILELAQHEVAALSLATIYRNLKMLTEAAEIRPVELPGESARYESARHGHHHHFQCRTCTRVFDIHACPGDFGGLAPDGFRVDSHELTLYGRCADCARSVNKRAAKA